MPLLIHSGKNMPVLKAITDNLLLASKIVRGGGLVVYPTDTVYGLGCDPFNAGAVKRLIEAKGERKKPLPILASDIKHVEKIAYLSERGRKIATKFWPGALTLVVRKKPDLSPAVTCDLDSVGVRMPGHEITLGLIRLSNGLLVGTSANKTGESPAKTAYEAEEQLGQEVDLILDGGPTTLAMPSTVLDLTSEKPKILRKGPISLENILKI